MELEIDNFIAELDHLINDWLNSGYISKEVEELLLQVQTQANKDRIIELNVLKLARALRP